MLKYAKYGQPIEIGRISQEAEHHREFILAFQNLFKGVARKEEEGGDEFVLTLKYQRAIYELLRGNIPKATNAINQAIYNSGRVIPFYLV